MGGGIFIISFLLSSFISIMALEKAILFWFLIALFLTYIIVRYQGKLDIKKTIFSVFFVVVSLVFLYHNLYAKNDLTIFDSIITVFSRAFTGSIQPAYHYLEFFPAHHDFLWGRSFPNPKGIFPFETFVLTKEIMNFAQPEGLKNNIIGSMPTIFWAETYANFGIIGVFIVPFIAGVMVWIVQYCINKFENTPIKVALYVWLIIHFKNLSITGFSGFIVDFYLIFTIGIVVITKLFYDKVSRFFK